MMQFYGCGINYPRCKEDCYWYGEWQDMNAHIPYCKCKNADSIEPKDCENCEQYHSKYKPINADRIRSMTGEELAEFESERMCCPPRKQGCEENNLTCDSCYQCWLDWLKQEANDNDRR